MSAIYCGHTTATSYGTGKYIYCKLCNNGWYAMDPAPIFVIGYTETSEVKTYPFYTPGDNT